MNRKSVLVIEDEDDIRNSFKEAIEGHGYIVHTARNGKEGLDSVSQIHDLGLIFLDLLMPIMSGWDFLKAAEELPTPLDTPVIIVTAFSERSKGLKARVIKKPVDLNTLLEAVDYYCGTEFDDAEVIVDIKDIRA